MKRTVIAGAVLALTMGAAAAHGQKTHDEAKLVPANLEKVENDFGRTGDPDKIDKVIEIKMDDEFRFIPAAFTVKSGMTVRFVVKNHGEVNHEMVIGRSEDLKEHSALMQKFPNMEHSEPYMAHAGEGQTAEIVWSFTKPGTFEFGCLVPGHYESGMKGTIVVAN